MILHLERPLENPVTGTFVAELLTEAGDYLTAEDGTILLIEGAKLIPVITARYPVGIIHAEHSSTTISAGEA